MTQLVKTVQVSEIVHMLKTSDLKNWSISLKWST